MKNNILRKIEYISIMFLISILIFSNFYAYASQKTELKEEQSDIEQQIQETNSEIAGVKTQMSDTLNQINKYNSQISSYESEISDLQSQIGQLQTQITEKEADIEEQQQKYEEQQELLNKRLVAMYESGSTSYLDMLLSSDGLADFISKYYIIEQLTEYDTELLEKIEQTRVAIENEKNELENSKKQVESSKTEIENKKNSLGVLVSEKNALVSNLSAEEQSLEQELEQFEKDKKEIQAQLEAIAAQEEAQRKAAAAAAAAKAAAASSSSSGGTSTVQDATNTGTATVSSPSTSGFICPLAGKSKSNITTGYYGYSGHTGVDFACSSGTPIMAAKSGTVVISTALRYSSGGYRSYGEYIVISHGDGTMTLYAHMSSRAVSVGTTVSQGQTIGYVGSTGNSTGPHLHFEVRVGGRCTNPTAYLP